MRHVILLAAAAALLSSPAAAQVPKGSYECWAFSQPRMLLNFKVTAPGKYRASDNSMGTFKVDPATKAVTFTGYLKDVLPDGFKAVYKEPSGKPTVSFIGKSGSEASFCERAGV